jgi:hypothetical protein
VTPYLAANIAQEGDTPAWMALAGVFGVLTFWYWSGRAPAWVKHSRFGAALCMFGPGGSLLFASEAINTLTHDPVTEATAVIGAAAVLVGMISVIVQLFTTAKWWGPRWYREEARALRRTERDVAAGRRPSPEDLAAITSVNLVDVDPDLETNEHSDREVVTGWALVQFRRPEVWGKELAATAFDDPPTARWRARYVPLPDLIYAIQGRYMIDEILGRLELHGGGVVFYRSRLLDWIRGTPVIAVCYKSSIKSIWVVPAGANAKGEIVKGARHCRHARVVIEHDDDTFTFAMPEAERRAGELAAAMDCELRP